MIKQISMNVLQQEGMTAMNSRIAPIILEVILANASLDIAGMENLVIVSFAGDSQRCTMHIRSMLHV